MSKRMIYHILFGLLALLMSVALSGCVYDSFDGPEEKPEDDAVIYLTLNIGIADGFGSSTMSTRAGEYYYEEPVRQNEKMHDLHVYIVDEGSGLEAFRDLSLTGNEEPPVSLTFKLERGRKKVYLFANKSSFPAELTNILDNLNVSEPFPENVVENILIHRAKNEPSFSTTQHLPMSESFDFVCTPVPGQEVTYVQKDVFVTRVPVKYTFITRFDADNLTVRLNGMARTQYFMPKSAVYNPGKYNAPEIINGIAGRNITSFTAPANPQLSTFELTLTGKTEVELTDDAGVKTKAYRYDPIYLMETPGTRFTMSIRPVINGEVSPWLDDHTLPNLPLLPRNTHVVINMGLQYNLDCVVDVVPYRGCILNPYFGLDPSVYEHGEPTIRP